MADEAIERQLLHEARAQQAATAAALNEAKERIRKLETRLQHLKNMAETAEEDIETGADYYYHPVISVEHLRRRKLI